jgi:hypothetical protein
MMHTLIVILIFPYEMLKFLHHRLATTGKVKRRAPPGNIPCEHTYRHVISYSQTNKKEADWCQVGIHLPSPNLSFRNVRRNTYRSSSEDSAAVVFLSVLLLFASL